MSKQFRQWVPTLPDTGTPGGTELIPCVKAGVSSSMTPAEISAYVGQTQGSLNILGFGGDNTGTNDNTSALQNAFAALIDGGFYGGGEIFFPAGVYKFTGPVTLTSPGGAFQLALVGSGVAATSLYWETTNQGITFDAATSVGAAAFRCEAMSFITGVAGGGTALTYKCSVSNAGATAALQSVIRDVAFDSAGGPENPPNYWGTAIAFTNVNNVLLDNVAVYGASSQGFGCKFEGDTTNSNFSVVCNLVNCIFNELDVGFWYGDWVQGVEIVNCNFTGCFNGIYVAASQLGQLAQLSVSNSQFGIEAAGAFGININTPIQNTIFSNCLFILGGSSTSVGIDLEDYALAVINDCVFLGPVPGKGIVINTPQVSYGPSCSIRGCHFFSLTTAITLEASVRDTIIDSNIFLSCTTAISDSASATTVRITNNIGYNDGGGVSAATNVGTSPATISSGHFPETHYLRQSATNTATVTKGGQQVATLAGATTYYPIELGPNESYTVTWTTTQPTTTIAIH